MGFKFGPQHALVNRMGRTPPSGARVGFGEPECEDCGTTDTVRDTCPVCHVCAEADGEVCCDGEGARDEGGKRRWSSACRKLR